MEEAPARGIVGHALASLLVHLVRGEGPSCNYARALQLLTHYNSTCTFETFKKAYNKVYTVMEDIKLAAKETNGHASKTELATTAAAIQPPPIELDESNRLVGKVGDLITVARAVNQVGSVARVRKLLDYLEQLESL